MRVSKPLLGAIIAATAALLLALFLRARSWPSPPALNVTSIEAVEIIDDSGAHMWLVNFNICNNNPDTPPGSKRNWLYVRFSQRAVEAKVGGTHWQAVEGIAQTRRGITWLTPGQQWESSLLTPAGTDCCRVWLDYTVHSTIPTPKDIAYWIAVRLPLGTRSRISFRFWRRVGFGGGGPSTKWREVSIELPLRAAPIPAPGAHNQGVERTGGSRFAQFRIERQRRLPPVAHAGRSAT